MSETSRKATVHSAFGVLRNTSAVWSRLPSSARILDLEYTLMALIREVTYICPQNMSAIYETNLKRRSMHVLQNRCPHDVCQGSLKTFLQIGHSSRSSSLSTNSTWKVDMQLTATTIFFKCTSSQENDDQQSYISPIGTCSMCVTMT